jgi:hypothetical protein
VIFARLFLKEPIIVLDLLNIALVLIGIVLIVKPPFIFGELEVYRTVIILKPDIISRVLFQMGKSKKKFGFKSRLAKMSSPI